MALQEMIDKKNQQEITKMFTRIKKTIPRFADERHKGQSGRIGVVGGSLEYTGAPYFAAISALRTGADLVHVFCMTTAAPIIKSYSPELIVHPLLDDPKAIDKIEPWLDRLHCLVFGPGLGRDVHIERTVIQMMTYARRNNKPMILDADALSIVAQNTELIKNYDKVILTPNAMEFARLFGTQRENIPRRLKIFGNGPFILEKGRNDKIHNVRTTEKYECPRGGSGRRCGGQGDLLCGSLSTFFFWALEAKEEKNPGLVASYAASFLVKECNSRAFAKYGRGLTASDMIQEITGVFQDYYELTEEDLAEEKAAEQQARIDRIGPNIP
ncbi:unnamed protein product [Hermetia illucens]|uniref:ATP-dependent (S)-NAD(P)H-hydrate dehydratase n=2 Tax=Hermetia illucens TaxID=343691 RepID=A0A7R8UH03_HERIL|nr:unnamed protein product [Hermetia illucens]